MDTQNLSLLAQLANSLKENILILDSAYTEQDKNNFDSARKELLDIQRKINFILKNKKNEY